MRRLIGQELFTFEEAGVLLGTSSRSISRAVRSGDLHAIQAPGTRGVRGRRISREEVNRYIADEYRAVRANRDLEEWRRQRRQEPRWGPRPTG